MTLTQALEEATRDLNQLPVVEDDLRPWDLDADDLAALVSVGLDGTAVRITTLYNHGEVA